MAKPRNIDELIGKKFNSLTVLGIGAIVKNKSTISCLCDCGTTKDILQYNLVKGLSKTCGCSHTAKGTKNVKHGLRWHPLYDIYMDMKKRCYNVKSQNYKHYGGKGVKVCDEWLNDFKVFYKWSIANGWQKGLEPDRYPDNDGNYEPNNLRFVSHKHNVWNNSRTNLIEYKGEKLSLHEWSLRLNINHGTLRSRIEIRKWSIEKAFTTPPISTTILHEFEGERKSIREWSKIKNISYYTLKHRVTYRGKTMEQAILQG